VPSEFAAPEVLSGNELILFSIVVGRRRFGEAGEQGGRAQRPLIVGDAIPGSVPGFVCELIQSGLSTNADRRLSLNEIIEVLQKNGFRIAEEVDSEAVSAFASSVESSEPWVKKNTPSRHCISPLRPTNQESLGRASLKS
jgi:hypothetical protein